MLCLLLLQTCKCINTTFRWVWVYPFLPLFFFCISVFCILGVISDIFHLTQPFIQCTSNCSTEPCFVLFFSLHVRLARRLCQPWSLEHTCWEHVALCVSEFLQKSLSLQRHFVDLIVCDLSRQQNSVEETINIQVNLSLQCFTTTCCWNLLPSSLFEGIRPELQKALWSTLKLAYFVKIPKASSQFLWDVCLLLWTVQLHVVVLSISDCTNNCQITEWPWNQD